MGQEKKEATYQERIFHIPVKESFCLQFVLDDTGYDYECNAYTADSPEWAYQAGKKNEI